MAALHSFWYDEAADAFREAQQIDPSFAMAYWGEAMSYNHVLWGRQDLEAARAVLHRLASTPEERAAKAGTPRERAFLTAVDGLYGEGDKPSRDQAYLTTMQALYEAYPEDVEGACFYALSILGTIRLGQDFREAMQAAAVLEPFFDTHPQHPGVLHYLIHAYDDPVHARLGLRPARLYAGVAPASAHALHMPAHIFVQLGRWEEAARSDEAAYAAKATLVAQQGLGVDQLNFHSLSWMHYEYLQLGQYARAGEKLAIAEQAVRENERVRGSYAEMKARHVVETRQWPEAQALVSEAAKLDHSLTKGNVLLAAGIASVRMGDGSTAAAVVGQLKQLSARYTSEDKARDADAVAAMAVEVEALAKLAEGQTGEALRRMQEAVAIEDNLGLPVGPPRRPLKPVVELYGEMLLEAGRSEEAIRQFEASLRRTPNRAASLLGLAQAAAKAGERTIAQRRYRQFLDLWHHADTSLAPLEEARHWTASQHAQVFAPDLLAAGDWFALTFTPDGNTMYLTRGLADGGGLFKSKLQKGTWTPPEPLAFSRGAYNDNDLFAAPDGVVSFFMSRRPITGTTLQDAQDIWRVETDGAQWGGPRHLGPVVNSEARDGFPSVTRDGTLYFFSERVGGYGLSDIYRARLVEGAYAEPENVGPTINTEAWDGLPFIAPDESFLLFFSTRPGGYGEGDLYVSYNREGVWTEPENLGPSVNTAMADVTPHVSPDGAYLFFARPSGPDHRRVIYYVDVDDTPLKFDKERFRKAYGR